MLQHHNSMHHCAISTGKETFPSTAFQQRSSESIPVPFILSNNNVISKCEQINFDCPQQPVDLFLDPDPAVKDCNVTDDSKVFVVITNIAAVNETTEQDKTGNNTNSD